LAVDAVSGGLYRLTPEQVQAQLQSDSVKFSKKSKESQIFVVMQPHPEWEKIGNLKPSL